MQYDFRTKPYSYQLEKFLARRDETAWGHLWDMGTGKTKEDIDQAGWAYQNKKINGWIIIAPNGIHDNWITEEIPKHLPESILSQCALHIYHSSLAANPSHRQACMDLLEHTGLAVLSITYDAVTTKKNKKWIGGKEYVQRFLRTRDTRITLDESNKIKSAGAKRTRAICSLGQKAEQRRIYTGMPTPNTPFDIYSQIKFLDADFWKKKGLADYAAFKSYFGVWQSHKNGATGGRFDICVAYRNLPELSEWLTEITDRVCKEDVLDLPDKVYSPIRFNLAEKQRKLYDELKDEYMLSVDDDDYTIYAELPLVRLLRLQQIACGWLPRDENDILNGDDEPIYEIPGGNPRLQILKEIIEDMKEPCIIWGRFINDITKICDLLKSLDKTYVRYDGTIPGPERGPTKNRFNDGKVQFFVGNPAVGGQGLTLTRASTMIYYSNSFNLDHRMQSKDRIYRIGQKNKVNYIDLLANDTVDFKIVSALVKKINVQSTITRENMKDWI